MSDFTSVTRSIIQLDYANAFIPDVRLNGGDENGRTVCVQPCNDGVPIDDENVEVWLAYNPQPGVLLGGRVRMERKQSPEGVVYECVVPRDACRMTGAVTLGFEIKRGDSIVCSKSFTAIVERPVYDAGSPEGQSYRQALQEAAKQCADATSEANALSGKLTSVIEQSDTVVKNAQSAVTNANEAASKADSIRAAAQEAANKANEAAQAATAAKNKADEAAQKCDGSKQAADQAAARADAAVSSMKQTVQDAANDAASKVQQAVERANGAAQQADSVREKTEAANKQTETDLAALKEEVVKAQRAGFSASSSAQKCDEAAQAYRNVSGEVAQAKQISEQAVEAANNALCTAQESATAVTKAQSVLDQVKEAGETAKRVVGAVEELKQTKEAALEATRTANAQASAAGLASRKADDAAHEANAAADSAKRAAECVTQALQGSEARLRNVEQTASEARRTAASANATSETARSTAEQAQSKANDAANAAQRAQSTANSAVEATDNNKSRISNAENRISSLQSAIEQGKSGAWAKIKSHTLTVSAGSFSDNAMTIAIPDALTGSHIVRTIGLKPASEADVKAYGAASPVFLDSDDDSSINTGYLRIVVKKPTDLKFTVLEQEVKQ